MKDQLKKKKMQLVPEACGQGQSFYLVGFLISVQDKFVPKDLFCICHSGFEIKSLRRNEIVDFQL